jgi:hypothetical protein
VFHKLRFLYINVMEIFLFEIFVDLFVMEE